MDHAWKDLGRSTDGGGSGLKFFILLFLVGTTAFTRVRYFYYCQNFSVLTRLESNPVVKKSETQIPKTETTKSVASLENWDSWTNYYCH